MGVLSAILDAIYNLLMAPVVMMGLLVCIGYILGKKPPVKVITGTISTMVGIQMVIFGGNQFSNTFKPIQTNKPIITTGTISTMVGLQLSV